MTTLFAFVGCIVVLGLTVAVIIAAVGYTTESRAKARLQEDQKAAKDAKRNLGGDLLDGSHWFSEDQSVTKAIRIIGAELQRSGNFDASNCREQWRVAIKATGEGEK